MVLRIRSRPQIYAVKLQRQLISSSQGDLFGQAVTLIVSAIAKFSLPTRTAPQSGDKEVASALSSDCQPLHNLKCLQRMQAPAMAVVAYNMLLLPRASWSFLTT